MNGWAKAVGPDAPYDLTVASMDQGAIGLSWTAPEDNGGGALDGYNVYRCVEDSPQCDLQYHAWVPLTEGESYTDDGVTVGTSYRYTVAASRLGWLSAWSNQVTASAQ